MHIVLSCTLINPILLIDLSVLSFQGKEIIEYYINELISEGVAYIPPWTDPKERLKPLPEVAETEAGDAAEGAHAPSSPVREESSLPGSSRDSRTHSRSASTSSHSSLKLGATAATIRDDIAGKFCYKYHLKLDFHCMVVCVWFILML